MNQPVHDVTWQQLADMPYGSWEPASVELEGKLYVLGGYLDTVKSSDRLQMFDPNNQSWTVLQNLPSKISHVNLVAGFSGFWFAGGMKDRPGDGQTVSDHIIAEVWHFDPKQDRYTAAPLLPSKRAGGGLARIGNNLHYISGLEEDRDTDSTDHWAFDIDAWDKTGKAEWTHRAPLKVGRNQLSVAVLNNQIYAIGGQFNHDSQQLDQRRTDIYDPVTDSWRNGPDLPIAHSHSEGATFVHQDRIWMVGGHWTPDGGTKTFCSHVLTLTEGGEWEYTCKLPKPISSPASRIIDGRLYVAGGWDGRTAKDKTWLSSPEVWVTDVPVS